MPLEYRLVDAFARSPGSGNVAGVVLQTDGLTDRQMRAVAMELNAPATAFLLPASMPDADIRVRWFTPACELEICGHATLAAVHAALEIGRLTATSDVAEPMVRVESKAGVLPVRIETARGSSADVTYWLDLPRCEPIRDPVNVPAVCRPLGLDPSALDPAIRPITTPDRDIVLGVRDLQTLLQLTPAMADLARYCQSNRLRGVMVTTTNALSGATAAQSRFFAPAIGVDEDAVSGSVHGPLGLHLVRCGVVPLIDGRAVFLCAQGKSGGRAGTVHVFVRQPDDGPAQVRIGGGCVTTAEGRLLALPRE